MVKRVTAQEAALLGEIAALKARAKMNLYKVLNDQQRAIMLSQYRNRSENIGALSNIGR